MGWCKNRNWQYGSVNDQRGFVDSTTIVELSIWRWYSWSSRCFWVVFQAPDEKLPGKNTRRNEVKMRWHNNKLQAILVLNPNAMSLKFLKWSLLVALALLILDISLILYFIVG